MNDTLFDLPATSIRPPLTVARIPGVTFSVWADITCGEACWHAREDICRCSCGGKNHGCLRSTGGERPVRTAKIGGERYELLAVGARRDVMGQADALNGAQFRSVDQPSLIIDGTGRAWTEQEIAEAKSRSAEIWFSQYYYTWKETDDGAPARVKYATPDQLAKWPELAAYRADRNTCLLWQRIAMPERPAILRVNKETGEPLAWQCPNDQP